MPPPLDDHGATRDAAAGARRFPVGAELVQTPLGCGTSFRVWAPRHDTVSVVFDDGDGGAATRTVALVREADGYFSGVAPQALAGTRYRFQLGPADNPGACVRVPDPASRSQPEGPEGPSEVVDPATFPWTDAAWRGLSRDGQVIYEMHVGTFTTEGTWAAAAGRLPMLAELGITVIEVMPVAEFAGRFGWGYDGVDLFAPSHLYGTPDDFRRFVDRAHALGLGVVLDVVYNHFGPSGNYLKHFSEDYFTARYANEWGEAINFDGEGSRPVRELVSSNAAYWIDEFHLDGLRLDATQQIFDASSEHIIGVIGRMARAAAGTRGLLLIAENEPQDARLVRAPAQGGYGLDALWNDDFHHSATVAMTGRREAYYTDYLGRPQEYISMAKWGFLYQGQRYSWQKQRRGTSSLDLEPAQLVTFLQNHDQVANAPTGGGERIHQLTAPGVFRAMTALLLLGPGTPMLFQGQEFCATSPFLYFADHPGDLGEAVRQGRAEFMKQFRTPASRHLADVLPAPSSHETFRRCVLRDAERETHAAALALHRDLLRLRRQDPAFRAQRRRGVDGAVLADGALVLRFFEPRFDFGAESGVESGAGDRLLIVNLGNDLRLDPAPEPLLAPPAGATWDLLWSSEDPAYGGMGTAPLDTDDNWRIPGRAAVVLGGHGVP